MLIDLGPRWGHIIRDEDLKNIQRITFNDDRFTLVIGVGDNQFSINSKPIRKASITTERKRLLGLANGIIVRDDMERILKTLETQTGEPANVMLTNKDHDFDTLQLAWDNMKSVPYFKFTIRYNPVDKKIDIDEVHNTHFVTDVIPDWLDNITMKIVTSDEERIILFAYENMLRMAEPILPPDDLILDGDNIPTIGGTGPTQTVDLSTITDDDITMKGYR